MALITPPRTAPQGSIWGHIADAFLGKSRDKSKEDPIEFHQRREGEELHDIGMEDGKPIEKAPGTTSEITHPVLKNIMAQLSMGDAKRGGKFGGMRRG
ncbi:MAG TPA: hypothetical protein VFR02_08285 [bacterium]|nr:hypothetical protein [bacterium]